MTADHETSSASDRHGCRKITTSCLPADQCGDAFRGELQALFRQTSVFVGGWTLAAAGQVCGENGMDVLDTTSSLLDKSLIRRRTRPDGIVEFSMTEGVREYAAERLAAHAEVTTVRSRHATHFAAEARQAEGGVGTADETE